MGLAKKLILSQVILLAIPTIVFGIYFFNSIKSNMILSLKDSGRQTIQRTLNSINRNVETCETAAQIMINNEKLIKAAAGLERMTAKQLWELKNGLLIDVGRIRNVNPDIYRLCIYSQGAKVIEAFPTIYSESRISDSGIYDEILKLGGRNCWSLKHEDELDLSQSIYKDNITSLYRKVEDVSGEYIGIIEASMLTNVFFNELYTDLADTSSFLFIADPGKTLIWNEHSNMPEKLRITSDSLYDLVMNKTAGENGSFSHELDGKPVVVVYGFAETIDSYVYNIISVDVLAKNMNLVRNNIMLGILAVIIILSVVTYFITSALLKKIKIMKEYMRKVQYGNVSVSVPYLGNDEIGELADHFQKMMNRINELITLTIQNQQAIKTAEIKALNAQINSHFTYNTLDTIQMMAEVVEEYEIADAVNYLGKLMRYSADWKNNRFSALRDEIKYAKNYISLINIKYDKIVQLDLQVEEDHLLDTRVPRMILQPVIENSVFHGIRPNKRQGCITIRVFTEGSNLIIEVLDNGKGIDSKTLAMLRKRLQSNIDTPTDYNMNDSIGLYNVHERIKLYYGEEYGISIESEFNSYAKVRIALPSFYEIVEGSVNEKSPAD
jgi:two-component system sensor histidine kinase YesM